MPSTKLDFSNPAYKSRLLAWAKNANQGQLKDWTETQALAILLKNELLMEFYKAFPAYRPGRKRS